MNRCRWRRRHRHRHQRRRLRQDEQHLSSFFFFYLQQFPNDESLCRFAGRKIDNEMPGFTQSNEAFDV